jgi:hypothetical protein
VSDPVTAGKGPAGDVPAGDVERRRRSLRHRHAELDANDARGDDETRADLVREILAATDEIVRLDTEVVTRQTAAERRHTTRRNRAVAAVAALAAALVALQALAGRADGPWLVGALLLLAGSGYAWVTEPRADAADAGLRRNALVAVAGVALLAAVTVGFGPPLWFAVLLVVAAVVAYGVWLSAAA